MVNERNRVLELKNYIESLGVDVNIGKTKARGNRGVFISRRNNYRIDVAKKLSDEDTISILIHEFAHYIHYQNDKSLKSIDFVFGQMNDAILEELINVTVKDVPKDFASNLFNTKSKLANEINILKKEIKSAYPDFKLSEPCKKLEKGMSLPIKYLLKYDNVRFFTKVYSVSDLDSVNLTEFQKKYILLKSKQRYVSRINSRINKLNRYYNNPSELFARFCELYYTDYEQAMKIAPKSVKIFNEFILKSDTPFRELTNIIK